SSSTATGASSRSRTSRARPPGATTGRRQHATMPRAARTRTTPTARTAARTVTRPRTVRPRATGGTMTPLLRLLPRTAGGRRHRPRAAPVRPVHPTGPALSSTGCWDAAVRHTRRSPRSPRSCSRSAPRPRPHTGPPGPPRIAASTNTTTIWRGSTSTPRKDAADDSDRRRPRDRQRRTNGRRARSRPRKEDSRRPSALPCARVGDGHLATCPMRLPHRKVRVRRRGLYVDRRRARLDLLRLSAAHRRPGHARALACRPHDRDPYRRDDPVPVVLRRAHQRTEGQAGLRARLTPPRGQHQRSY